MTKREQWGVWLESIAAPVINLASMGKLKESIPKDFCNENSKNFIVLEAVGRTICGLAPWLNMPDGNHLADKARKSIVNITDPKSPDFFEFSNKYGNQPLVDAAFLALGIMRAPKVLWEPLSDEEKANIVSSMKKTHSCDACHNNWLLFAAMVETFLYFAGEEYDKMRIDYAITTHMDWYKGDGFYGDGAEFQFDYYNSFVIQPMITFIAKMFENHSVMWKDSIPQIYVNANKYAVHLECMIGPDGTYPAIGRSLAYRFGAFHLLAHMALDHTLPSQLPPAQVREALDSVLKNAFSYPDMFTEDGWLSVGLSGYDPDIAQSYINTGSLYLCTTAFLPLGLDESDPFWSDPPVPFTGKRIWNRYND